MSDSKETLERFLRLYVFCSNEEEETSCLQKNKCLVVGALIAVAVIIIVLVIVLPVVLTRKSSSSSSGTGINRKNPLKIKLLCIEYIL